MINTTGVTDYFAVINFNSNATHLGDNEGINGHKEYNQEENEALQAGGCIEKMRLFKLVDV